MNPRRSSVLLIIIYFLSLIGVSMTITVQTDASSGVKSSDLVPGDMGIVTAVHVLNITIYYIGSNTSTTTATVASYSRINPIYNIPEANIVSGSDTNVLFNYFTQQMFSEYYQSKNSALAPLVTSVASQVNGPTIYSLSQSGFKHLGVLPTIYSLSPTLRSFNPKFSSFNLESSNHNAYINDFETFVNSTGVNQSDFNAPGTDSAININIAPESILNAAPRSLVPLSNETFSSAFNSTYYNIAVNMSLINSDGTPTNNSLNTENVIGLSQVTSKQNYRILNSGYSNFNYEAIVLPIIKFYIVNNTNVDTNVNDYTVTYTSIDSANMTQGTSSNLKSVILSNINSVLTTKSSLLDSLTANANNIPIASTQTVTVSVMGIPISHIKENSFTYIPQGDCIDTCGATGGSGTSSGGSSGTESTTYTQGTNGIWYNYLEDETANTLLNSMTDSSCYSNSWCGSFFTYSILRTISDPNNPNLGLSGPVNQFILLPMNSFIHYLLPFAPILFIGLAITAGLLLFYFHRRSRPM